MKNLEDEKIVEQILQGKKEYYSYLVDRYKKQIFTLICRLAGNIQNKEDMAQEIFIKVYKNLNSFNRKYAKFSTWFYKIAQNHCLDYLRKKKIEYADYDINQINQNITHPEEIYFKKEEIMNLQKALGQLEVKYRLPLVYKYIQDLSYEDISQIMNLPLGTVKIYIYRGKKKILNFLTETSAISIHQ